MKQKVSIVIVGIGGYGRNYLNALLDCEKQDGFKIVGAVDPFPEKCDRMEDIKKRKIPVFSDIKEFYERHTADLAVISSPINFHCPQTEYALSQGSNVLCEKPLCATVQDAARMSEAEKQSGKHVFIGYQWSFSDAIQNLKQDISKGLLGSPLRFKTIVLWPRNDDYFKRGWAGKQKDRESNWILDSVANNATAHYLHNMFYVMGDKKNSSAKLAEVKAELYRANKIENFDTIALRAFDKNKLEYMFFATHSVNSLFGPCFRYEFEKGEVIFEKNSNQGHIIAVFNNGDRKDYGNPFDNVMNKLWIAVDNVKSKKLPLCGIEAAYSHTLCINGVQESMPEIKDFPADLIHHDSSMRKNKQGIWVEGLYDVFMDCYNNWKMPYESGVRWAKNGKKVDLTNYNHFSLR